MSRKRPPVPKQTDREGEALKQSLSSQEDFDRSRHDVDNTLGQSAGSSESITIDAESEGVIYHGLGHVPSGWRVVDATGSPASHVHQFGHHIDADAAGPSTETHWLMVASVDLVLVEAFVLPNDALVANDVNYATLSFGHYHPGGSTDFIGSMTTQTTVGGGTGNWVAGTPIKLSDFDTIASQDMEAGTVMVYDVDKSAGAGVALPDHEIIFEHTNATGCWLRRVSWDSEKLKLSNENNYALTLKVEVF